MPNGSDGVPGHPYEHGFDVRLVPEKLTEPLKWVRPRMIFVNSMSDLFQDEVRRIYCPSRESHEFGELAHLPGPYEKGSAGMRDLLNGKLKFAADATNIWWGVSVENKKHGLPRVRDLQLSAATVRFLSIEPLLEDLGTIDLARIDWVIVGGESGPGARPMSQDWVINVRNQCRRVGVRFFFKQWGGRAKGEKRKTSGRTHLR